MSLCIPHIHAVCRPTCLPNGPCLLHQHSQHLPYLSLALPYLSLTSLRARGAHARSPSRAQVWDWDRLKPNDFSGEARADLDPLLRQCRAAAAADGRGGGPQEAFLWCELRWRDGGPVASGTRGGGGGARKGQGAAGGDAGVAQVFFTRPPLLVLSFSFSLSQYQSLSLYLCSHRSPSLPPSPLPSPSHSLCPPPPSPLARAGAGPRPSH